MEMHTRPKPRDERSSFFPIQPGAALRQARQLFVRLLPIEVVHPSALPRRSLSLAFEDAVAIGRRIEVFVHPPTKRAQDAIWPPTNGMFARSPPHSVCARVRVVKANESQQLTEASV